jgi:hypothetical protein
MFSAHCIVLSIRFAAHCGSDTDPHDHVLHGFDISALGLVLRFRAFRFDPGITSRNLTPASCWRSHGIAHRAVIFSFPPEGPQCFTCAGGMITMGGTQTFVVLNGGFNVFGAATNRFVPDGTPFPATVGGEFLAYACPFGNLLAPGCIGLPAIADIVIDLPGAMGLNFSGPNVFGNFTVDDASFTSVSIPESSSLLLVLVGAAPILIGSTSRRL